MHRWRSALLEVAFIRHSTEGDTPVRKPSLITFAALTLLALACGLVTQTEPRKALDSRRTPSIGISDEPTSAIAEPPTGEQVVVFEVNGRNVAVATSISYGVGGNTSQANDAKLPWRKQANSAGGFLMVSLVAQSASGGNGSITCRISVGGKVLIENTSQGPYAVVTCNEVG